MDLGQKIAIVAMVIGAVLVIVMGRQPRVDIIQNRRKSPRGPRDSEGTGKDGVVASGSIDLRMWAGDTWDRVRQTARSVARGGAR